jgi:hypothetical protein
MPNAAHLLSVAALATGLGSDTSLETVKRAQFLIQSHTWSEVVRIENTGASSRYPRKVNALVFQLDSVLWFYTPTDGTQSLSLFRGRAESDKHNLGNLLAAIDEGFTAWEVMPREGEPPAGRTRLPNGCFIESMAILFDRLAHGARIENPKQLSYYVALPGGMRGHTVLQFASAGRVQVIDPDWPSSPRRIRYADEGNATSVALRIRGDIAKARHLPLDEFLYRPPGQYCATVAAASSSGHEQPLPAQPETSRNTRS